MPFPRLGRRRFPAGQRPCDDFCRKVARAAEVDPATLRGQSTLATLAAQPDLGQLRNSLAHRLDVDPHGVDWHKIVTVDDLQRFALAYSAAGHIAPQVKDILAAAASSAAPDLRIRFGDGSKQLRNARASMKVPADETVLGLLNATFSGDGTEGMVFGTRGLYYRTTWLRRDGPETAFISYDELADRVLSDQQAWQVSLGRGQYFVLAKSSMRPRQLVEILERIQAATKAHHAAALAQL
jgi:hypothetical protein